MSDRPALTRQALVIQVLARLDGPDAVADWEHLRALWRGCADHLGMSRQVPELDVPEHLPAHPGDVAPGQQSVLLAACQRDAPGIWQALVRREHDVVCLLVALAPAPDAEPQDDPEAGRKDDGLGWGDLERDWAALAEEQGTSASLGAVWVLAGVHELDGGWDGSSRQPPAPLVDAVEAAVPGPATPGWWRHGEVTPDGFAIWEASPSASDDRRLRRLVVTAPPDREEALDRWVWTTGDGTLTPLARYLLHAAKLRHQLRVYTAEAHALQEAAVSVDTVIDEILALHGSGGVAAASVDRLVAAGRDLAHVQAGSAGLVVAATRLAELRRTIEVAQANMHAAVPYAARGRPGGLFDDDRSTARWLQEQLEDDRLYLDAARERATEVARITEALINHRLAQLDEAARRKQDRLSLLQTSFLGALLMGLAAIQALGYTISSLEPVQAPVIALLTALALCLPTAVLRLSATAADGTPFGVADHLGLAALGASTGWLAASVVSVTVLDKLAGPSWTIPSAAAGALLATAAGGLRSRQIARRRSA